MGEVGSSFSFISTTSSYGYFYLNNRNKSGETNQIELGKVNDAVSLKTFRGFNIGSEEGSPTTETGNNEENIS